MKFWYVIALLLCMAVGSCQPSYASDVTTGNLPNSTLTPGDVRTTDTAVVCDKTHSTKEVRNVPGSVKHQVFIAYGLNSKRDGSCNTEQGCEVDHLISLELGGSNDVKNLWPEPYQGTIWNAHAKDRLENEAHKRVCAGRISLTDAQNKISSDWNAFYVEVFGEEPKPE